MLDVALDNRATMALLTWGLSDRFLRQESTKETLLRGTPRMLPFDGAMRPIETFFAATHQDPALLVYSRKMLPKDREYINNFVFVPAEKRERVLARLA